MTGTRHQQRGLTMIEAVVSLVIVTVLGAAALRAFSAAAATRAAATERARGVALAGDLLSEVAAAPYGEPPVSATETEENRVNFTTTGAYHGWSASPPVDRSGAVIASLPWRREVTVRQVELDGATSAAGGTGLLHITVRVFKGERLVAMQEALRSSAWDVVGGGQP